MEPTNIGGAHLTISRLQWSPSGMTGGTKQSAWARDWRKRLQWSPSGMTGGTIHTSPKENHAHHRCNGARQE